jgi:iron complex transport system substrate-binding protein
MRGGAPLVMMLSLAGCGTALPRPAPAPLHGVVSLDYCADQMVLGLVPRDRIRAVSPEADSDAAFSMPRARGIPRLRPSLEEIAALRPRYAVRLYGGAPGIDRQLAALGITVVQLNPTNSLADVPDELARVGVSLDAAPQATSLITAYTAKLKLAQAAVGSGRPTLLYTTPGDVTTGNDGFLGDVIQSAGFRSVRAASGWGSLPLEAMVRRPPDAVLRAFYDSQRYQQDRWSSSAHPRLRAMTASVPTATVPGSALACGNWLAGDAMVALGRLRRSIAKPS